MKKIKINEIPAIIWGEEAEKVIIAVHGNLSHKEDIPIKLLAEDATKKGYQVLSFDLPEHGDRKSGAVSCKVKECVEELKIIMEYVGERWKNVLLFANSMGAYFSLIAYRNVDLEKALFLSPVVDMGRIIENMMKWFNVTEERLEKEQTISTPIGQNLYWDYYCYVKQNPICNWDTPTAILYADKDELVQEDTINDFAEKFDCEVTIANNAEHYFHTDEHLEQLKKWLNKNI